MRNRSRRVASACHARIVSACAAALVTWSTGAALAQAPLPPPPPPLPAGYPEAQLQPAHYGAPAPYGGLQPYSQSPGAYYGPLGASYAGPKVMEYEEGDPIPAGYHLETRTRRGLIVGGAVTFGTTYLLTVLTGLIAESVNRATGGDGRSVAPLYIPVAGPFIALDTMNAEGAGVFVLVLDGLAQAGGVAMLFSGIAFPALKLVRNDVALSVHPLIGGGTVGLGVHGAL
jgi:hypothetical protein